MGEEIAIDEDIWIASQCALEIGQYRFVCKIVYLLYLRFGKSAFLNRYSYTYLMVQVGFQKIRHNWLYTSVLGKQHRSRRVRNSSLSYPAIRTRPFVEHLDLSCHGFGALTPRSISRCSKFAAYLVYVR